MEVDRDASRSCIMRKSATMERMLAGAGAVLGWLALAFQLRLAIAFSLGRGFSMAHGLIIFFGFFTVLTNILVALVLHLRFPSSRLARFPRASGSEIGRPRLYRHGRHHLLGLLRPLWMPSGTQLIADRLLHDVLPPLYLLYWIAFVPKGDCAGSIPSIGSPIRSPIFVYILLRGALHRELSLSVSRCRGARLRPPCGERLRLLVAFLAAGFLCVGIDRALAPPQIQRACFARATICVGLTKRSAMRSHTSVVAM